jgi:hypothetical protein
MTTKTFEQLLEYNTSVPTGVYEGKMWKAHYKDKWLLRWFGHAEIPNHCSNNQREIILVD